MIGRFRRKAGDDHTRVIYQAASWCLSYPDDEVLARLPLVAAALSEIPQTAATAELRALVDRLCSGEPADLRRSYIDLFDLSRKNTLYLSYWTDGDTRRRGSVLGEFKQRYRDCGWLVDLSGELPDHLPIVLEFAARADLEAGRTLLSDYRVALELIRFSLLEAGSDYAAALAAICASLPGASPADRRAAMAMHQGVPTETVGLEPFDPRLLPISPTAEGPHSPLPKTEAPRTEAPMAR